MNATYLAPCATTPEAALAHGERIKRQLRAFDRPPVERAERLGKLACALLVASVAALILLMV